MTPDEPVNGLPQQRDAAPAPDGGDPSGYDVSAYDVSPSVGWGFDDAPSGGSPTGDPAAAVPGRDEDAAPEAAPAPPRSRDAAPRAGRRTGRRAELRRQRRERRRRVVATVLSAAVVVALALTAWLVARDEQPPQVVAEQRRTQATLLLALQAPNGTASAVALLAHDPASNEGAGVFMPAQTIVNVPSDGPLPLARALRQVPPEGTRDAVSDALQVLVDAGWVLHFQTFAALVDALGGVPATVDVPVLGGPDGRTILVEPGEQRLSGLQAYELMTLLGDGELEQLRLARQQEVVEGLLEVLPQDPDELVAVLDRLGPRSVPSVPTARLAAFLVGLADDSRRGDIQYDVLPVQPIDAGGVTTFRIDQAPAREVVERLLAQSVPASARETGNRVLVMNGTGAIGLGERVRARLVPAGFVYLGARNASRFGYERTIVLVKEATPAAQATGVRVARALGVPDDAVQVSEQFGSIADIVVIVGADFRPA